MMEIDVKQLIQDVESLGYKIDSIKELENITKKEKDLVPIMIKHIQLVEPLNLKTWFVNCLSKRGLYGATDFLLEEFKRSDNSCYKWAIGNALEIIKNPKIKSELLEIAKDKTHGSDRERIVAALGIFRNDVEVRNVLIDLLNDKDVTGHALEAIKKCGLPEDIPYIEPYLLHKMTWIRREAERAITQIKKREEKRQKEIGVR